MVPLINNAGQTLRWFVEDVWGQFVTTPVRPGVPLLASARKNADGTASRVGDETLRSALAKAAGTHLPDWPEVVTPHVMRHFCASQLYLGGMDLIAIQATLGHAWIATTMQYVHEPSGIASAGRETAQHQAVRPGRHLRRARRRGRGPADPRAREGKARWRAAGPARYGVLIRRAAGDAQAAGPAFASAGVRMPRTGASSCVDCLAWGVLHSRRCGSCSVWRHKHPGEAECAGVVRLAAGDEDCGSGSAGH